MELLQKVHDFFQLSLLGLLVGPALLHDGGWDPPLFMEYLLLVQWAILTGWKRERTPIADYWFQSSPTFDFVFMRLFFAFVFCLFFSPWLVRSRICVLLLCMSTVRSQQFTTEYRTVSCKTRSSFFCLSIPVCCWCVFIIFVFFVIPVWLSKMGSTKNCQGCYRWPKNKPRCRKLSAAASLKFPLWLTRARDWMKWNRISQLGCLPMENSSHSTFRNANFDSHATQTTVLSLTWNFFW